MRLVICPNCNIKVLPMTDDRCPNCNKIISKYQKSIENKYEIRIFKEDKIPDLCINCCDTDTKMVVLEREREEPEYFGGRGAANAYLLKKFLGYIGMIIAKKMKLGKQVRKIELPICDKCNNETVKSKIIYDFENQFVEIFVVKLYKKEFEKINQITQCPFCKTRNKRDLSWKHHKKCEFCLKEYEEII